MRHRRKGSRLNRKENQLKALLRNLTTSFVLNGKMVTTEAKAKAFIPMFDRLVRNVRSMEPRNAIREMQTVLFGEIAQRKFMHEIVPSLAGRPSGFIRKVKVGFRAGDNAPVVHLSLVSSLEASTPAEEKAPVAEVSE